jgi:hypothetical protein
MPVVANGGRGIGVEAQGTNFPFTDPSPDIEGLFADFYLSHQVREIKLPLRISWMRGMTQPPGSGTDPIELDGIGLEVDDSLLLLGAEEAIQPDLIVLDANDLVVFDSTSATFRDVRTWSSRFYVLEWRTALAECRAVLHAGANDEEDVQSYPDEFEPENATLDERASDLLPKRVLSLTVNGVTFDQAVEIVQGYNLAISPTTAAAGKSRRARTRLVISAEPGSGSGRFPSCEETDTVIRQVNNVGPDAQGNLILSAADCYWLERPVTNDGSFATPVPATLQLNSNCGTCCECSDYENTYQGVRRLHATFKDIGSRASYVKGVFKDNIERWERERACRKQHPTKVNALANPGGYLDVAAGFTNVESLSKYDVELHLTFSHNGGQVGEMVPCMTVVSKATGGSERRELSGAWGDWWASWACLDPGRAVHIRTRLRFPSVADGDSVTVTATPYLSGVAQPSAEVTVAMFPCGV